MALCTFVECIDECYFTIKMSWVSTRLPTTSSPKRGKGKMAGWAKSLRKQARAEAVKRGHSLSRFTEGYTTYLAVCRNCTVWVEVTSSTFRFYDDKRCPP